TSPGGIEPPLSQGGSGWLDSAGIEGADFGLLLCDGSRDNFPGIMGEAQAQQSVSEVPAGWGWFGESSVALLLPSPSPTPPPKTVVQAVPVCTVLAGEGGAEEPVEEKSPSAVSETEAGAGAGALLATRTAAGQELSSLSERLVILAEGVAARPLIASMGAGEVLKSAEAATAAARALLGEALEECSDSGAEARAGAGAGVKARGSAGVRGVKKREEITHLQRAVRFAAGRVLAAEQLLVGQAARLELAEAQRATARASVETCRADLERSRAALSSAGEEGQTGVISYALGEAEASLEAATAVLSRPITGAYL
ncbi:unnamed protein product, partial [Discosporangium mesarthrocarpum]